MGLLEPRRSVPVSSWLARGSAVVLQGCLLSLLERVNHEISLKNSQTSHTHLVLFRATLGFRV